MMTDFRIGGGDFFARGLEGVSHLAANQDRGLPEQRKLTPADQMQRPQFEEMLALPNMASFLEKSIQPDLNDPDLLQPVNFQKAHDEALQAIAGAAERMQASDPDGAKIIRRAQRVLTDDKELRQLVHDYRNALHAG
jgi:hypothetical protein